MTTFQIIILIMFVCALCAQFIKAIETDCLGLMLWFGFEIMAFAYLAKALM